MSMVLACFPILSPRFRPLWCQKNTDWWVVRSTLDVSVAKTSGVLVLNVEFTYVIVKTTVWPEMDLMFNSGMASQSVDTGLLTGASGIRLASQSDTCLGGGL